MSAANSRMNTIPASSQWMILRIARNLLGAHRRHLPGLQRLAPAQELDRRHDGDEADRDEQPELAEERVAREIVGRPLLEKEDPQEPDYEHHARRGAEHAVDDHQPARRGERELLADQRERHGQRRDQGERREVMEKGEEHDHAALPFDPAKNLRRALGADAAPFRPRYTPAWTSGESCAAADCGAAVRRLNGRANSPQSENGRMCGHSCSQR